MGLHELGSGGGRQISARDRRRLDDDHYFAQHLPHRSPSSIHVLELFILLLSPIDPQARSANHPRNLIDRVTLWATVGSRQKSRERQVTARVPPYESRAVSAKVSRPVVATDAPSPL